MRISNLDKPPLRYLFTREDEKGETISLVELIILPDLFGKKPASYIHKVYTDEEYKGRGFASELLKEAIKYSVKIGCYKIFLVCNSNIVSFYQKLEMEANQVGMEIRI